MTDDFDWKDWVDSRIYRRTLLPTQSLLNRLGVSQDYWDMVDFYVDLCNERPAFRGDIPVGEALALGVKGLETKFENCEGFEKAKSLLGQVISDIYKGDKIAWQIFSRMDGIRGGDSDIYRWSSK
ncbi:hypothetical protein KY309_02890 [Candidatus Woesearchaeota archaeon]|nr:hypothetical protein [Candidatus Woesearchaeota archaeon]